MAAKSARWLLVIACFKLLYGALSVLATVAIVHLFHKNVVAHAESWLDFFQIDTDNQYVGALLWRLKLIHTHELHLLAGVSAFYSALFLTEGVGLAMKQRWAEYLALVATGLFVPVEIYELCKEPSIAKGVLLVINIAVVAYLTVVIRWNTR
jgi:uncharacterized membrane protein (DUF2068 family)